MLTAKGYFAIAQIEDLVIAPYLDQRGTLTWGIGHTDATKRAPKVNTMPTSTPINVDGVIREAWNVFCADIEPYERAVTAALPGLKPHEKDGWVMWHFNTGGLSKTKAVAKWKAGDKAGAVAVLQQWNKVTIKGEKLVSDGLVKRRQQEADMILKGVYPGGTLDVYRTDGNRHIVWSPKIASYDIDEWHKFIGYVPEPAPRRVALPTISTDARGGGIVAAIIAAAAAIIAGGIALLEKIQGFLQ